jgi:serine O-acetyltransferase
MGGQAASLLQLIREDRRVHKSWFEPGFHGLAVHRLGAWRLGLPVLPRKLVSPLYRLGALAVRNLYGIEIPPTVHMGRRVEITDGGKLVIAPGVVIGDGCILRHNVTIAPARRGDDVPTLGHNVAVGTGAVILGKVTVGDYAEIGPNAIVLRDVPDRATVFSDPSRVVVAQRAAWDDKQKLREESGG